MKKKQKAQCRECGQPAVVLVMAPDRDIPYCSRHAPQSETELGDQRKSWVTTTPSSSTAQPRR
jgi:hypothetical protein